MQAYGRLRVASTPAPWTHDAPVRWLLTEARFVLFGGLFLRQTAVGFLIEHVKHTIHRVERKPLRIAQPADEGPQDRHPADIVR